MRRAFALVVLFAALLLPASAGAATRYATPGGGMVPGCAQATPCSLEYAIGAASPNDEIVVGAGDYTLGATIETGTPLWIHGAQGVAKPRIFAPTKAPSKALCRSTSPISNSKRRTTAAKASSSSPLTAPSSSG